jgi:hypothetical protein
MCNLNIIKRFLYLTLFISVCFCFKVPFVQGIKAPDNINIIPGTSNILVKDGEYCADIVTGKNISNQVKMAAEVLAEYIKKSTGVLLPICKSGSNNQLIHIHVGPSDYVNGLNLDLASLDADGFVISFPDAINIVIVGPSDWGTEFGVYEFLERYIGVRWLMPGPDGEYVPKKDRVEVPRQQVRQEPAFFSRLFSGLPNDIQQTWARRNRMHGRISFHHNLIRLFPPEEYTKTHPEFFPIINGKRYLPLTNSTHGWQPCFTAPGIVGEAIKNINKYFDEHPEATSYSLGVNDASGHCECERCCAKDSGKNNFLGKRDVSDRYFEWANAVVEGVLKKHPDKWFGCLAYSELAEPPSRVKVHPRIIPFMTYDRMKWIDPEIEKQGKELTERWYNTSPVLGWYDYIYGTPYCLPRVYFHAMADYYRYAQGHGVKTMYAEAYPNWGEGPKLYIALKLMWDPTLDVDAMLTDWYTCAVGKKAATDLATYYALWENFWTERIRASSWFTSNGQLLNFRLPDYLYLVTNEDLDQSRSLLESTLAKTVTPMQNARAKMLLSAFEYYEASAKAYLTQKEAYQAHNSYEEALEALARVEKGVNFDKKRQDLVNSFKDDPVLIHPTSYDRYVGLQELSESHFFYLIDWMGDSNFSNYIKGIAQHSSTSVLNEGAKALLSVTDENNRVSQNPSFEGSLNPWTLWIKWDIGKMQWVTSESRTGTRAILCEGIKRGGPNQTIEVTPGKYAAVGYVKVPTGQKTSGTAEVQVVLLDTDGKNLKTYSSKQIYPLDGIWTAIGTMFDLPDSYGGKDVRKVRLIMLVNGFQEHDKVLIDDLALYKVR